MQRTPYVLTAPAFRFRALAALAEHLPLGGERETALASLVAARLVADAAVAGPERWPAQRQRGAAARQWFSGLALPVAMRTALQQVADAVQRHDGPAMAAAWDRLQGLASRVLDAASRAELRAIAPRSRADGPA